MCIVILSVSHHTTMSHYIILSGLLCVPLAEMPAGLASLSQAAGDELGGQAEQVTNRAVGQICDRSRAMWQVKRKAVQQCTTLNSMASCGSTHRHRRRFMHSWFSHLGWRLVQIGFAFA